MNVKNNLIISFGKCAIEVEDGETLVLLGNAMLHISSLSKCKVDILKQLFPESINFIEQFLANEGIVANRFELGEESGYCLIKYKGDENG